MTLMVKPYLPVVPQPGDFVTHKDGAFCSCTSLTNIVIPESVTYIGWGAFKDCTGLTSITILSSVTEIDHSAFAGCTGLKEITVSSENLLEEVELPEGVKVNIVYFQDRSAISAAARSYSKRSVEGELAAALQ